MTLSKLKVKEMREKLEEQGWDKNQLADLKRPQLLNILKTEGKMPKTDKNQIQYSVPESNDNQDIANVDRTQKILNMFDDDEMDNEHPRVDGLRRVAELILGTIIEEGCDLLQAPCPENGMRASVKAWVVFATKDGNLRYEALAESSPQNTFEEFSTYPVSMADTRAKGRCFRNALKLKKVVSAEELGAEKNLKARAENLTIDEQQMHIISRALDKRDVSLIKLLEDMEIGYKKNENGFAELKSLLYTDAQRILARLSEYNSDNPPPQKIRKD